MSTTSLQRAELERELAARAKAPTREGPWPAGGDLSALFGQLQRSAGNHAVNLLLRQQAQAHAAAAGLPDAATLQRHPRLVQRQGAAAPEGGPLPPALGARIAARRGSGSPLDAGTRAHMEGALGASLADVRMHTDAEADQLNRGVGAPAFTTGSDIFFSRDAYQPGTAGGTQLLAHELTHVVQQRGMAGGEPATVGPADDAHEREAEAAGAAVVGGALAVAGAAEGIPGGLARRLQRSVAAPPNASPGLHEVLGQIEHAGQQARRHVPSHHLAHAAQEAAPIPANDSASRGHALQAGAMNAAPAGRPEPQSFRALLHQKLAEIAPKNNDDVKNFKQDNKAAEVHGALTGEVQTQTGTAAGPIAGARGAGAARPAGAGGTAPDPGRPGRAATRARSRAGAAAGRPASRPAHGRCQRHLRAARSRQRPAL
jgi:hypothetical protein